MLRKLMKYEFMATGRVFLPLFAALLLISAVNRVLSYLPSGTPFIIGSVAWGTLIAAISILTLILTLQRFRSNLLSSEGYLTMTLPAGTNSIIFSKMFVAAIWAAASTITVIIAIAVMASTAFSVTDLIKGFAWFFSELFKTYSLGAILLIIECIVAAALLLFFGILMLYACMSLSMLVNKRRGLFTFGAFIVMSTLMQTISAFLIMLADGVNILQLIENLKLGEFGMSQLIAIFVIGALAIMSALFFYITRHMLKNRLNLQ